jgi:hypothetical protein
MRAGAAATDVASAASHDANTKTAAHMKVRTFGIVLPAPLGFEVP